MDKVKNYLRKIIILLFVAFAGNVNGQVLTADSSKVEIVPMDTAKIHSPKKAALYSAILPGLGQAYNKKYLKIPLVYAGIGTIGYFIGWNNKNYKTYRSAYSDLTDGDDNTNSYLDLEATQYYDLDNSTQFNNFKTGLSRQQDYYRRNRDLLFIGMFAFYGLNIIDASVDAHFFDFDISEDLTMNWQPSLNLNNFDKNLVYGFNCTFNF